MTDKSDNDKGIKSLNQCPVEVAPMSCKDARDKDSRINAIPFSCKTLNNELYGGGLASPDFFIVGALAGGGKTAFSITELCHQSQYINNLDLDTPMVLYMTNEETPERLLTRVHQMLFEVSKEELQLISTDEIQSKHNKVFGSVLQILDISGLDVIGVEQILKRYNPVIAYIDQVDSVEMKSEYSTSSYDAVKNHYYAIAQLAKKYCPIVALTQASPSALKTNKDGTKTPIEWPTRFQLSSNSQGKIAQSSTVVMISYDDPASNIRNFGIVRNKQGNEGGIYMTMHKSTSKFTSYLDELFDPNCPKPYNNTKSNKIPNKKCSHCGKRKTDNDDNYPTITGSGYRRSKCRECKNKKDKANRLSKVKGQSNVLYQLEWNNIEPYKYYWGCGLEVDRLYMHQKVYSTISQLIGRPPDSVTIHYTGTKSECRKAEKNILNNIDYKVLNISDVPEQFRLDKKELQMILNSKSII